MAARSGMETPRFLSVDDAAELLSISKRTIYGWVQQRKIPYRKAGKRLLFLESELLDWTKPNGSFTKDKSRTAALAAGMCKQNNDSQSGIETLTQ